MDVREKIVPVSEAQIGPGTLVLGGGYLLLQAAHVQRFSEAHAAGQRVVAAVWDDPGLAPLRPAAARAHLVAAARDAAAVIVCTPEDWTVLQTQYPGAQFEELDPTLDMRLVATILGKNQTAKA